jgi:hypothetical protein
MDYTTLIERLLDGTITADEQAELDRLMNNSPVVAQEVRQLMAVERILRDNAYEEEQHSLAFRESVRTGLKASLGFGGVVAATNLNAPSPEVPGNQNNGKKYGIGLLALLLLGAVSLYLLKPDSDNTTVATPAPVASVEQKTPAVSSEPDNSTATSSTGQQLQTPPQKPVGQNSTPEVAPQQSRSAAPVDAVTQTGTPEETAQEKELSGTVQAPSNKESQYRKLIDTSIQKLQEQSANPAIAAVTARQIALLYEKLGERTLARQYFDMARGYARQGAVRETEGEITGEYALFEQRAGNVAKASALASESLQIFRSAHSEHLEAWEKVLQPLIRNK